MITTIHARPQTHAAFRGVANSKQILCPRCAEPVGIARGVREAARLISTHRCLAASADMLQPSTAVPFS